MKGKSNQSKGEAQTNPEVTDSHHGKPVKKTEPIYSNDLIAVYTAFRDQVYAARSVLHPCCEYNASPAKVFDNATFVDLDAAAMELFKRFGLKAHRHDIREYKPTEEHDLVILLNPEIQTEWATQHLRSGGYVLSNDYHENATWMHEHPEQFTLVGVIDFVEQDRRKNDNRVVVSRDVNGLFVPVKDGEELMRLRPDIYEYLMKSMPFMIKLEGGKVGDTFEDNYARFAPLMNKPTALPAKKVADWYIFMKR